VQSDHSPKRSVAQGLPRNGNAGAKQRCDSTLNGARTLYRNADRVFFGPSNQLMRFAIRHRRAYGILGLPQTVKSDRVSR
jgi:hypothetical protein